MSHWLLSTANVLVYRGDVDTDDGCRCDVHLHLRRYTHVQLQNMEIVKRASAPLKPENGVAQSATEQDASCAGAAPLLLEGSTLRKGVWAKRPALARK